MVRSRRPDAVCIRCRGVIYNALKIDCRFGAGGDPCGSSSGSGVGVSAGFAPVIPQLTGLTLGCARD